MSERSSDEMRNPNPTARKALALQVQAQLTGQGEIIVVMNGDPEHGAQEPFFIGEAAALYDTKAGVTQEKLASPTLGS